MSQTIDLNGFPQALANALSIPLFVGQILASLLIMSLFTLPFLFMAGAKHPMVPLMVGISSLAFTVALGWMPVWVFVIMILMIALMFGRQIVGFLGGEQTGSP
jgi:hypothetical protein